MIGTFVMKENIDLNWVNENTVQAANLKEELEMHQRKIQKILTLSWGTQADYLVNCVHDEITIWRCWLSLMKTSTVKLMVIQINSYIWHTFRDRHQIQLLISSKFKWINWLLFPLKSSENPRFSDDFKGNRSWLIRLNSLTIRGKIWWWSLNKSPNTILRNFISYIWDFIRYPWFHLLW